jgi:hypothetical protein
MIGWPLVPGLVRAVPVIVPGVVCRFNTHRMVFELEICVIGYAAW